MSNQENITIRLAVPDDTQGIKRLGELLLASDRSIDPAITARSLFDIPGREESLQQHIEAHGDNKLCLVAEIPGLDVVGYATAQILAGGPLRSSTSSLLENICVAPGQRRKGIGRLLFSEFIGWADSRGATYHELNVLARNTEALQFYKAMGFAAVRITLRKTSDNNASSL